MDIASFNTINWNTTAPNAPGFYLACISQDLHYPVVILVEVYLEKEHLMCDKVYLEKEHLMCDSDSYHTYEPLNMFSKKVFCWSPLIAFVEKIQS